MCQICSWSRGSESRGASWEEDVGGTGGASCLGLCLMAISRADEAVQDTSWGAEPCWLCLSLLSRLTSQAILCPPCPSCYLQPLVWELLGISHGAVVLTSAEWPPVPSGLYFPAGRFSLPHFSFPPAALHSRDTSLFSCAHGRTQPIPESL